jgi:hypothetical protein
MGGGQRMKRASDTKQIALEAKRAESCTGHREKTDVPWTSGFGCTKEEALNALFDEILKYLENNRKHKCGDGQCGGAHLECTTVIENPEVIEDKATVMRMRWNGCPHNVGWRASWGYTLSSYCICVPRIL